LVQFDVAMTADQLSINQSAVVVGCSSLSMQEIGFIEGEIIKVIAQAPFGGPKAVRVGLSAFAVRDEELVTVEVRIEE